MNTSTEARRDEGCAPTAGSALPKTLQAYVDYMAREDRPLSFPDIVTAYDNGRKPVNHFRRLKSRGLVENVVKGYEPGEAYDGPRFPLYVLTEKGRGYVSPQNTPDQPPR